jgi:hypothetical protein
MRSLLGRVGVGTYTEGVNFVRVFADRADWDVIHTFPFCVWGRVPGGR